MFLSTKVLKYFTILHHSSIKVHNGHIQPGIFKQLFGSFRGINNSLRYMMIEEMTVFIFYSSSLNLHETTSSWQMSPVVLTQLGLEAGPPTKSQGILFPLSLPESNSRSSTFPIKEWIFRIEISSPLADFLLTVLLIQLPSLYASQQQYSLLLDALNESANELE